MSVLLQDLKPGDLFRFSLEGLDYVYEGRGWCHLDLPGQPLKATLVEPDQIVFHVN